MRIWWKIHGIDATLPSGHQTRLWNTQSDECPMIYDDFPQKDPPEKEVIVRGHVWLQEGTSNTI